MALIVDYNAMEWFLKVRVSIKEFEGTSVEKPLLSISYHYDADDP